jgi:hypothetical protein
MDGATAGFLLIGMSHLVALVALFWMLLRNGDSSIDGGWFLGRDDEHEPRRPRRPRGPGGDALPLPDAQPSAVRLREPGRIADAHPAPARRGDHEPGREREPACA